MTKKIAVFVVFMLLQICCSAVPSLLMADDNDKELQKNWAIVLDSVKAAPADKATYDKLDSFSARWKDSNRLEASRAIYLKGMLQNKDSKYTDAYDTFKMITEQYTNSPFADSANYKMGESLYNQGKYADAIDEWSKFRFKFSSSLFLMEAVYGISLSYLDLKEYKKADRELNDFLAKFAYYGKDDNVKFIGGLIDYYLERYDDAIAKLQSLKTDASYYYLGHSLIKESKYLDAAEAFKNVSEGDENKNSKYRESALYNKAEAFYKGENYPVAANDYLNFMNLYPSSNLAPYAVYKRGAALYKDKKYDLAAAVYKQVVDSSGDNRVKAYGQYLMGECQLKLNKYDLALAAYEKVMSSYPDIYDAYASALVKAGWCYSAKGNYAKAQEVLKTFTEKFITHESLPLGYYLLGNSYYMQKQYGAAVESYKFILDKFKYSDLTEAAILMIELCYYNQGQFAILTSESSATLAVLSDKFQTPKPKIRSRAYYYLGEAYMNTGMYGLAAKAFQEIVDKYYDSDITTEARANLAWCFFQLENYRGARTMAKDVASNATASPDVKKACEILIAHSYFSEKDYEKAAAKYGEFAFAHEKDKDSELTAEALFQQGKVYEYQEFYNDAIKSWQVLAGKFPKSKRAPEALFKMSDIYNKAGQYDKSLAGFQEVITKYPKDPMAEDAMLSIAEVYYNSEQEAKAVDAYKKFMAKYPDSNKVTSVDEGMQRASYRKAEKANDPKLLLEFYTKYPQSNLAVGALYKAAELYYTTNKFKEAIESFNKVIEQFPNDTMAINAHYYIGACYEAMQKSDEAVAAYKAFIKNYPKHELASDVTFRLATAAYQAKNYTDAVFYYERIIEKYPGTDYEINAMYNCALAYGEFGKQDDAIRYFKLFAKTFPKDPKSKDIPLQIAGMYLEAKRYKEAIAAYNDVYIAAVDDAVKDESLYRIGDIYASLEQSDKAIETYSLLMKAQPKDNVFRVTALIALATLYEEKLNWKAAVDVYEEVAVSNGQKEYVAGAIQRKADIKAAYPDAFKTGASPAATTPTAGTK
jgi:TolA-binding protein